MGKKLSKEERQEVETRLALLRTGVTQCEQALKDDDAAGKASKAAGDRAVITGIADRDGAAAAILAIRSLPQRGSPQE
jgi:hypothetical protein